MSNKKKEKKKKEKSVFQCRETLVSIWAWKLEVINKFVWTSTWENNKNNI